MIDHALATTNLINAALKVADRTQIKKAFPLDDSELDALEQLKRAVKDYRGTKQPKRIDETDDDFDSLHGCG